MFLALDVQSSEIFDRCPIEPSILFWLVTNPSDLELLILEVLSLLFMFLIHQDRSTPGLQSLLLSSQSGA